MAVTYEELMAKARELAAEGRTEEARRVGQIAINLRREGQEPAQSRGLADVMAPINQGIANVIDGMASPINRGINALVRGGADLIGVDNPPQLNTRPMQQIMADTGVRTLDGREPQGVVENILVGTGEAAGALLPMGAIAKGLSYLGPVAAGVGQTIMRPFTSTPVRAVASELAAGAGARVAQEQAEQLPDNFMGDMGRAVAPLVGGFAASVIPSAAGRLGAQATGAVVDALPVTGVIAANVRQAVAPFTRAGAFDRAASRVRDLVADPEAVAAAMQRENPGNLTPAQLANDPNLLRLEQTAMVEDPRLRNALIEQQRQSQAMLAEDFRAPANGATAQEAQDFIRNRQEAFRTSLQARVQGAQQRAEERIRQLDPARRETQNSVIVRQELDRAYEAAARQENALWRAVPRSAEVPVDYSRETFNTLLEETARARAGDIPIEARQLLGADDEGGFGDTTTVQELHGLYSRLRQTAREAMGQTVPNENRARIANTIADAILRDLGATDGLPTAVGRTINQARAFSAEMNAAFNQGPVGSVMSMMRNGGERVAPELTLARTVGPGGDAGAVAVDSILAAQNFANNLPNPAGVNVDPAMQDFLRGRLMDVAAPRGTYDPRRAEDFIRANREMLSRQFPEIQGDIGAANMAVNAAQQRADRVASILRTLDNPRETITTAFVRARPGQEIAEAVLSAQNPARAADALVRAARRDETGRALDGLKGGFLDHLISQALGNYDTEGVRPISGNTLNGMLQEPGVRGALNRVLEPAEIARLDRIAKDLQGLEGARSAEAFDTIMNDEPNALITIAARIAAARYGAQAGGGSGASLQTAQMASSRMQRLLARLTNDRGAQLLRDAVTDRDLFVALMTRAQTPDAQRMVERRLIEWMVGSGAVSLSDLAREERAGTDQPAAGPLRMTLTDPGNQSLNAVQ